MRGKLHTIVNNTRYSILFDHKLTNLFSIENFSGAKHAGKVLIIIIILFLIIIIICYGEYATSPKRFKGQWRGGQVSVP